jgi:F-type H+-transporting ATPase subunit gamma
MPSLKDIRRRIGSVRKTQQITRAMRMVAAAKLRRAQAAIESARPYAERMRATLAEVAASQREVEHPMLAERSPVRRIDLVVVSSDRGLCGAFNANVLKRAERELAARRAQLEGFSLIPVGAKACEFFRHRLPKRIVHAVPRLGSVDYGQASALAARVGERFLAGEADEVLLVHSEFVTTMTQRPRCVRLLPFRPEPEAEGEERSADAILPYTIEPSPEKLLRVLVPKALEVEIFRALLDSQAGEHAARMTAMESATRNTEEMIERLTLQYNRARQAAITKELVEIVSGAEAL